MNALFDDHGIRFAYPSDWELDVESDGTKTNVSVAAPDGVAFALLTLDESCPPPDELAGQALEAITSEYPDLDASEATETIDGRDAVGHDVEFFTFDAANSCVIRAFGTDRRTVCLFAQWSDLGTNAAAEQLGRLRRTLQETDEP